MLEYLSNLLQSQKTDDGYGVRKGAESMVLMAWFSYP